MMHLPAPQHRSEISTFGTLTLAIACLAALLSLWPGTISAPYRGTVPGTPAGFFNPVFGTIPPMLVVAVAAAVGGAALSYLRLQGWFAINGHQPRGVALAVAIGLLFGAVAAGAESAGLFREPADTNVPVPYAFAFYPVGGYVMEMLSKALPLAVLLGLLGGAAGRLHPRPWMSPDRMAWTAIVIVAALEPLYMVSAEPEPLSFAAVYVGGHVFAINLVQLFVFRRYDFLSMYVLRLSYYLIWHVIWGSLRLQVLF